MSLFGIIPIHDDAFLVSFNEILHHFRKDFFFACFFGDSSCTKFTVPQIIMQYGLCASIADLRDWRNSSVFQDNQVTDPLDVFFPMRR